MRFCVDCRFFEPDNSTCAATLDIVHGTQSHLPCADARSVGWQCGPDGVLFKEADGTAERRIARERARVKPNG